MPETEVFQTVWKRYLPVIVMKIKEAGRKNEPATFNLYRPEFQQAAKKKKNIPIAFTLEMKNGRVKNNIGLSPLAKDLSETFRQNPGMGDLMERAHFKFTVTEDAVFTVEVIPYTSDII